MKLKEGFEIRGVSPDLFIVESLTNGNYNRIVTLNKTAAKIWIFIKGKDIDIADCSKYLTQVFDIEYEEAFQDVTHTIEFFKKADLIDI